MGSASKITRALLVAMLAVAALAASLVLLAWLGYDPPRAPPPRPPPAPVDCVPDRLVSGEGLTMARCFALDAFECSGSEGCALLPRAVEL